MLNTGEPALKELQSLVRALNTQAGERELILMLFSRFRLILPTPLKTFAVCIVGAAATCLPLTSTHAVAQVTEPEPRESGKGVRISAQSAAREITIRIPGPTGTRRSSVSAPISQLTQGATASQVASKRSEIKQIAPGWVHSCALSKQGGIFCWGNNTFGQLGNGSQKDNATPLEVSYRPLAKGAISVAVSGGASCAVNRAGGIYCWGINDSGELGDGTTKMRLTPDLVKGIAAPAVKVAMGLKHACALLATGEVQCWGANTYRQLGAGSSADVELHAHDVVDVEGPFVDISAGAYHSCALTKAGAVRCWGKDFAKPTLDELLNTQYPVSGLETGVLSLASGPGHACVVSTKKKARCWGDNREGQLGDGNTTSRATPSTAKTGMSEIVAVTAGGAHSCALTAAGSVWCWGNNQHGQQGNSRFSLKHSPTRVPNMPDQVSAVTAGGTHVCVLTQAGEVFCWGGNKYGQLGDGSKETRLTPVIVKFRS